MKLLGLKLTIRKLVQMRPTVVNASGLTSQWINKMFDNPAKTTYETSDKIQDHFRKIGLAKTLSGKSLPLDARFRFGLFFRSIVIGQTKRAGFLRLHVWSGPKSHPLRFPTIQFNRDWANGSTGAHEVVQVDWILLNPELSCRKREARPSST